MRFTMSLPEAARALGRTERTVRNYIKEGRLASLTRGRSRLLDPAEVMSLIEEDASPRVTPEEVRVLRAQVQRLESEMAVVRHMLDLRDSALGMTEAYAAGLYDAMIVQSSRPVGSYSLPELESWADIFARMDESDLEIFCRKEWSAWKQLLLLSARLITDVVSRADYKTSLDLQKVHRLLADGRRRLRISCFIYLEMRQMISPELREAGQSLRESLKSGYFRS
jgi:excisionase family DNA binding protein